jgi:hypothetical protein
VNQLELNADQFTEDVWQYVSEHLDDPTLDSIGVKRTVQDSPDLASEPVTTTIVLTLAPLAAVAVLRLIEKWMEAERQRQQLEIVLRGFAVSDEAGKAAASLAGKHAQVSIKHGLPTLPARKA